MKKTILTPLSVILPAMFLFLLLKTFFLDFVQVKGHSMDPSLVENEFLFINRAAFGIYVPFLNKYLISWSFPQRGDILILREPDEDKIIVKRCAGLPGDSVRVLQDTLEIGNSLIPVEYSDSVKFNGMKSIEKNKIFVIGDNLENSIDSRKFGFITFNEILGKVLND